MNKAKNIIVKIVCTIFGVVAIGYIILMITK